MVSYDPQVFDSAEDNEICDGGIAILHSEVIGGAGNNSYKWQQLNGGVWEDIFGANGSDYMTDVLVTGAYTYRVVVVQDAGCEAVSDGEVITVNTDPLVVSTSEDNEICDGGMAILHSSVIGGAGPKVYQWQELINGNWEDIFGANGMDYYTDPLATGS